MPLPASQAPIGRCRNRLRRRNGVGCPALHVSMAASGSKAEREADACPNTESQGSSGSRGLSHRWPATVPGRANLLSLSFVRKP